jgi:hypothetical protein
MLDSLPGELRPDPSVGIKMLVYIVLSLVAIV